jgi:hypothetical protein
VYSEPKSSERHHMWSLLRRIKPDTNIPWLMIGDFNETKWKHEHFSEMKRSEKRMADFSSVLSFCNLHDIDFAGPPCTYDNKQNEKRNVKARIDRVVASHCWSALYPEAKLTHVISARSDHLPLLLELDGDSQGNKPPSQPRYESMWERDPKLKDAVEEAWSIAPPCSNLSDLMQKIKSTSNHMKEWSVENFGHVNSQIKSKRKILEKLWKKPRNNAREEKIRMVSSELDELLHREKIMWRQRSRVSWLK